jgi:lipoprotein-anchoring transpeptidase ErfK/SrfK
MFTTTRYRIFRALLLSIPIMVMILSGGLALNRMRGSKANVTMTMRVDLSERELHVIENGDVVRTYGVAVGTRKHPTPTGQFWTGRIEWNPRWVPPPTEWARRLRARDGGDPRNPMQGVKIYFKAPYYYIHGTNNPSSIGSAASHGCLRMRSKDAKALARRISKHGSVLMVIQH